MKKILLGLAVTGAMALCASAALAQDQPPAAAPQTPTDVKGIGDWTVRCFSVVSTSPCEMYEEMDDKNTRQRILGISIAFIPSADRHLIQIAVPLGVSIPKGLVVQTDSFTSAPLHYRRCDRAGCYVEMVIDNNSIDSMSHSGPQGAIKIVADNGKPFDLRMSLNGFSGAHDAMAELAKQKAKTPAAPPAAPTVIK